MTPSNALPPDSSSGDCGLMTQTVPKGDHFQDLRFWDSNQIGEDRDIQLPSEDIAEQFQRMYSDTQAFAAYIRSEYTANVMLYTYGRPTC